MSFRIGRKYRHLANDAICACCDPRLLEFTQRMNADMSRRGFLIKAGTVGAVGAAGAMLGLAASNAHAQSAQQKATLFENVRIFDGKSDRLSPPSNVLVLGKTIKLISTAAIAAPADAALTVVQGDGRTLIPGLIDAHTHIMFATIPQIAALTTDISFVTVAAVKEAGDSLLRGFTSIRDMGGPVFGLKRGIDSGLTPGPRIWPSGAFISQTGGHGDFRLPNDLPARPDDFTYSERVGGAAIADSPDVVRKRAREQLALGASQLKLMAGGGVSSVFDPLDVTQYTMAEIRAAVEAAENWGTYVSVHAYTPRAVTQALEGGVKCIEHGNLLDDATAAALAQKSIWWCLQPFLDDEDAVPFPPDSPNRKKQITMLAGTDTAYALARKHGIKTAWGTDTLFDAKLATRQGAQLTKLKRWYKPAEILRMATGDNGELLALSGPRSPYEGRVGVVQEGALADLLLVNGDPIANIGLIEDAAKNFSIIMKDGAIYKNTAAG